VDNNQDDISGKIEKVKILIDVGIMGKQNRCDFNDAKS